ncbi:BLUF domain-containing protein [Parasphingorhabdus sp.]|uniref:BLUF domain-containing protein n=1 Tax=Parasphingorhabdus sp. TaxID=2709688 RepID=UPI003C77DAB4
MYRLVYMSTPKRCLRSEELSSILAAATRNNHRNEITGILIQDRKRFLQYLEGSENKVEETFARIASDSRHHAIFRLKSGLIDRRQFPGWSMASKTIEQCASLKNAVSELVKCCDHDVVAELLNFAEARDRAA